ncbi:MerR family DNA-binding protein [Actinopolymorpha sp. B17G11]|uniref:MerR family transcriptional regulator n=1 Tax=Actinopolymorpha sp. B17G11 TaxID=3160861 RepID=UPI0032E462A6
MRTAQVADRAGVNAQTLRYYERRGLLPDPGRTGAGYRTYGPEAVRIVRFVKRAQQLGFTLTEIQTMLGLADGGPDNCEATRRLAAEKISELDAKIASLIAMRDSLTRLVDTCARPRNDRDCPLLHSLDPIHDTGHGPSSDAALTSRDARP